MSGGGRIVTGVHGTLGSLQALRFGVELARERNVRLVPVCAWLPPGGDLPERQNLCPDLRNIWCEAAGARLRMAFEEGLGGVPSDVPVEPLVVLGEAGPVLVDIAEQDGDLLVIGTGRRGRLGRALHRSVGRYCLAHAHCPVLAVPPSALMESIGTGRPWRRVTY